jgi:hypothetical protein
VLHYQDEEINVLAGLRCDDCEAEICDPATWAAVSALYLGEVGEEGA